MKLTYDMVVLFILPFFEQYVILMKNDVLFVGHRI